MTWIDDIIDRFPSGSVTLWIRHGHEYHTEALEDKLKEQLNADGHNASSTFGKKLAGRIWTIVAAPGDRSRQTAEAIAMGAGVPGNVISDKNIGDPSAYVADYDGLMNVIKPMENDRARQSMLDGILRANASWATNDPSGACHELLNNIRSWTSPEKFSVLVTPNVPIGVTVALALGLEDTLWQIDLPRGLEGAVFFPDGRNTWIQMGRYSGRSRL
jgi:hypothetical protein